MLNITLTLTASPEFLNILSKIADAFTNAEIKAKAKKEVTSHAVPTQTQEVVPAYKIQTQPKVVPTAQPAQPAQPSSVPTAVQNYTMDQLAVAATQLMDAGHKDKLINLLSKFGVQALTMLPKEQYGAFATELRAMGAKI